MNVDHGYPLKQPMSAQTMHDVLDNWMRQYGQDIWNFVYTLTRNQSLSDDLTQDVFVKAFHKMSIFRHEASAKTWLFKIARHTVYDYQKSAFVRKVTFLGRNSMDGSTQSAEDEAMSNLVQEDIWKSVFALPPKLREVLLLYGHQRLTLEEIGQIVGVSVGTVKSRLHRARKSLEARMREGIFYGDE